LAEAGLKRRTRFGSATLMIAANLPDIDVLSFLSDVPAVALRRGWTHGVLAQAVLPILLTGAVLLFERWRPAPDGTPRARGLPLLVGSYLGVLSHVGMDWLNNYGVRLLMPFSNRWFYGDAVFIIDPWLWLVLAAGIVLARRWNRPAVAAAAVSVAAVYILIMVASAFSARQSVLEAWVLAKGTAPAALMVGPVPVNPLRKTVIVDAGDHYARGTFAWWPTRVRFDPQRVPKNDRDPAVVRAAETDSDFRAVLRWARFPYYALTPSEGGTRVRLADLRFPPQRMFEVSTVITPE
jgi:inner membrane protein